MPRFTTELVPGGKAPYHTWTFAVVPDEVHAELGGKARTDVRGTINGAAFRATISRGEGRYRFAVTRGVRDASGVAVGMTVEVVLEPCAPKSMPEVPTELRAVLDAERLWSRFEGLAPSCRRAWIEHVDGAKRAETRTRRAAAAPAGIRGRLFPGQR